MPKPKALSYKPRKTHSRRKATRKSIAKQKLLEKTKITSPIDPPLASNVIKPSASPPTRSTRSTSSASTIKSKKRSPSSRYSALKKKLKLEAQGSPIANQQFRSFLLALDHLKPKLPLSKLQRTPPASSMVPSVASPSTFHQRTPPTTATSTPLSQPDAYGSKNVSGIDLLKKRADIIRCNQSVVVSPSNFIAWIRGAPFVGTEYLKRHTHNLHLR